MPPTENIFNLDKIIAFRHWMHKNAEPSMKEFKTQQAVIDFLLDLGIPQSSIKKSANTGLTIDIHGTGPSLGAPKLIACRADLDGLIMEEFNDLPYKSVTNTAHMCGHDGHTAMLLGFYF